MNLQHCTASFLPAYLMLSRPFYNFVHIPLPDWRQLRRARLEGCPYSGCSEYTIVCRINFDGSLGEVLEAWPGNSLDMPHSTAWWDEIPWCWFTTSFLTTTSASSQTDNVPADWTTTNTIEAIGGGGSGGATGASGAGAGAYAIFSNYALLTPGGTTSFQILAAAAGVTVQNGNTGGDVWYVSNVTLLAKGGIRGSASAAAGGAATSCLPLTGAFSGGAGGDQNNTNFSGSGGGGGGGPSGTGKKGGTNTISATNGGGGGGGGAAANSATSPGTFSSSNGQAGGLAQDATAGGTAGTGGTSATAGGAGSHGSGGGGGGGITSGNNASGAGNVGGVGLEWDATHGAGGGGGGSGGTNGSGASGNGGAAGNYGGGGGAAGFSNAGAAGTSGAGAQGIIVKTYTPAAGGGFLKLTGPGGGAVGDFTGLVAKGERAC